MAEKFSHKHPSVTEEQQIPFVDIAIPLVGDSSSAKVCLFMLCIVVIVIHPFLYLIRLSVCQIDSQSRFSLDTSVNYPLPTPQSLLQQIFKFFLLLAIFKMFLSTRLIKII